MANEEHLARLREGVKAWNEWRVASPGVRADLRDAILRGADLTSADLNWAEFQGANLAGANLLGADLRGANLSHAYLGHASFHEASLSGAGLRNADINQADLGRADLTDADLHWANLTSANLTSANLRAANLRQANLILAKLSAADFTGATVGMTIFGDNDLSTTKGLETVTHAAPSTIGIDTIYNSQGKIPLKFLRGCGVPEDFITYIPSLVASGAVQFYSCFISYSTKDQEFADRLYADLQNKGVRCWFAPHDMQSGKKLHEQIDAAIRVHERLLVILSPNSMNSGWVETEIRNARKREFAEKKRVLFPVGLTSFDALRDWKLFNADEGRDLATEIREFYIPDFSRWKEHNAYKAEFEKLVRDLRVEPEKST